MAEHAGGVQMDSGARRLGDFTLLRLLGKGSQGEVWEARQESLGRLVALKLLPPQLVFSEERLQRFQREAEAGGRLSHPGIVTVYAIGEQDGVHFFAQELVAGGRTLADVIDEARRLPELPADWHTRMAETFSQVTEALHAAHVLGVIHRDVKPGNILLGEDGRPKLADFGLARVQDDLALSVTGDLAGTPFYMSPEQVQGLHSRLDHRSDVFSLGSSLYEALTLARPFNGDRQQIMERIVTRDPPDPRRVHRHVPRDLSVICLKALEKQPARRFATAGEMAEDLRRWLAGAPIHARPPGLVVRTAKWTHRHPRLSAAGSVAALAFALVTWQWMENRKDKQTAVEAGGRIADALAKERSAAERMAAALAEADAQRQRASSESQNSERVVTLLEDVFSSADPLSLTADETVQPPDVLDRGTELVAMLDGVPAAQWRLVLRLGRGYRNVGLYAQAATQLQRALDIARRDFGEHDERTATSSLELARVQRLTGRWAEADALARQALDDFTALHGSESLEALAAVGELGLLCKDAGRTAEAEARLRQYLDGCLNHAGDTASAHTVLAAHALGQFLLEQGRLDEAARVLGPAREQTGLLPEYHALLLGHTLARLDDLQGRDAARAQRADDARRLDAAAEQRYLGVLDRQRVLLGDGNHDTLATLNNLGTFYRERGRPELARPLLEEAVSILAAREGPAASSTLYARNNLARVEYAVGDKARAEAIWTDIVATDRADPQPDRHPVLAALSNLASLARDDGRLELAEDYAEQAVQGTAAGEPELAARQAKLAGIREALAARRAAAPRP
jgi:eukaryotic-like serine/threonine-protein kinase